MNTALQIQTKQPKISFKQIFLLILLTVALFMLTHWFSLKQATPNASNFKYEELTELAEEIYNAGAITDAVNNLPIDASALAKMTSEIERILRRTTDYPGCELYYLQVLRSGDYPVLAYGNNVLSFERMQIGDVWKVGQTCNSQEGRYPSDLYYSNKELGLVLTERQLKYTVVKRGNYKEILILEKLMIYTYSLWSGHSNLLKPPGCKIFR